MNGAQTYKYALRQKRTYIISAVLAIGLGLGLGAIGLEKGYQQEGALLQGEKPSVISTVPYAEHFMEHAPTVGWEWEMLAAVAFQESHFNPEAVSKRGASGLLQLMPKTYKLYGLNDSTAFIPESNIAAGAQYLAQLKHQWRFIKNPQEQTKFVLACYNAGPAHILDARRLARKYGANPNLWSDTEYYLDQLKYEEFYSDSIVQYGHFNGTRTIAYVHSVLSKYDRIKRDEARLQHQLQQEAIKTEEK